MTSSTTEPFTDDEILAVFSLRQVEQDNSDNDKDANDMIDEKKKKIDEPVEYPKKDELLMDVIKLLPMFSLFADKGSAVHPVYNQLQCKVDQHLTLSIKN